MIRQRTLWPLAIGFASMALFAGAHAQDEAAQEEGPPPIPPSIASPSESDMSIPRGVITNKNGAFDGYTLIAPLNSRTVFLLDMDGETVHTWTCDTSPAGGLYMLDDGSLLRCGRVDDDPQFRGGGIGGVIQKLSPEGPLLWSYMLKSSERTQHHDVEPLPNGNVLAIHWERISAEEAIQRGRSPEHVGKVGLWPDVVVEIRPEGLTGGEIVWEWHSKDHLVQDTDPALPNYGAIPEYPERIDINGDHRDTPPMTVEELEEQRELEKAMEALGYLGGDEDEDDAELDEEFQRSGDWLHTNAVDYDPTHDLIALSTPHFCEIWILDHSTTTAEACTSRGGRHGRGGDLLWRWGNPRMHGAGATADQRLFYQHDPTFQARENGQLGLLLFNNGGQRPDGNYSTVLELDLPLDSEGRFQTSIGKPHAPDEPSWFYEDREGFYSGFISGAQRLPNGNTLICSGVAGRVFEVTPEGEVVWDFRNGLGGDVEPPDHAGKAPTHALFRATRLGKNHPGIHALLR